MLTQRDEVVGVRPPPPGVTPDFADPPSRVHTVLTAYIVCTIISTLCTVLRLYTARSITRQVKVDDYLLFAAWFFALGYSLTGFVGMRYGFGRHLWDVPVFIFNPGFMKVGAITGTFYGISIMLTKLSILSFFLRFVPLGNLRTAIYVVMAVVVLYSMVASFVWVYACRPVDKFWDPTITGGSCIPWLKVPLFSGVMNTVTDATILILPFIILRDLRLPMKHKIGVLLVLMAGGFVLIVSIIRLKLVTDLVSTTDISWDIVPSMIWWTIETHVAIVCACLPTAKPLLQKHMPNIFKRSYGNLVATMRLSTISTHTSRLPLRVEVDGPQNKTLGEDVSLGPHHMTAQQA